MRTNSDRTPLRVQQRAIAIANGEPKGRYRMNSKRVALRLRADSSLVVAMDARGSTMESHGVRQVDVGAITGSTSDDSRSGQGMADIR